MYIKKKKIIIISLIILIAIILTILISGYIFIRSRLTVKGIIVECKENSILVYEENKEILTYIGIPKNINLDFKPGQEVIIYLSYDTCTTGSYPGSISSEFIKKIKIIKENANNEIVEEYNTQKQEKLLQLIDLEQMSLRDLEQMRLRENN